MKDFIRVLGFLALILAFVTICFGWSLPKPVLIILGSVGFIVIGLSLNLPYSISKIHRDKIASSARPKILVSLEWLAAWGGAATLIGLGIGFIRYGIPFKELLTIAFGIIGVGAGIGLSILLIKQLMIRTKK